MSGIPIEEQTYERNLEAVERIGATVVLKQHGTEIYFCNDDVYKLPIGTPAMATGGMGDTGHDYKLQANLIILKKLLQVQLTCIVLSVKNYLTMYVVPPSRLISEIPYVMKQLEG